MNQSHHSQNNKKQGFTLIELSLSMAFIGILSITIALIINDTISTYRRGLTLNQINTVGMDLVDEMRAAIQNSSSKSILSECQSIYEGAENDSGIRGKCSTDGGKNLVSVTRKANVKIRGKDTLTDVPIYGAFCTGTYSYIWNSGYFFDDSQYEVKDNNEAAISPAYVKYYTANPDNNAEPKTIKTIGKGTDDDPHFKLLKIEDKTRGICTYTMKENEKLEYKKDYNLTGVFETSPNETISEEPIRLIVEDSNDTSLALYDLEASAPIESNANNGLFYYVSFILGTVDGGVNIMSTGNFCATPGDYENANFDYCAINKFNFAAQATGT